MDLNRAAREGTMCAELYYRLAIVPVHLDPLRERCEDLPLLAAHFAAEMGIGGDNGAAPLSREALQVLESHSWPGNVQELKSLFRRAAVLDGTAQLTAERLRELLAEAHYMPELPGGSAGRPGSMWSRLAERN